MLDAYYKNFNWVELTDNVAPVSGYSKAVQLYVCVCI